MTLMDPTQLTNPLSISITLQSKLRGGKKQQRKSYYIRTQGVVSHTYAQLLNSDITLDEYRELIKFEL